MAFANWLDKMLPNDYPTVDMQNRLIAERNQLREVLSELLVKQGMATPAWEPAREVLGLPSALKSGSR